MMFKPRFSLRALLVAITALCLLLWFHLDWIARRRASLTGGRVTAVTLLDLAGAAPRPPWLLGWFGEEGQSLLILHNCDDEAEWNREESRLARLFPEAEIRRGLAESIFDDPATESPIEVRPLRR